MKKFLLLSGLALLFISGCSFEFSGGSSKEKGPLTLQLTKVDEEEGYTIEDSPLYTELESFIEENPKQGAANDFSMYVIDVLEDAGQSQLLLLGINRVDEPINESRFDVALGTSDGEIAWEDLSVTLGADEFGAFKVDHAMPILLPIEEEQIDVINTITEDNQVFEMDNFDYESE